MPQIFLKNCITSLLFPLFMQNSTFKFSLKQYFYKKFSYLISVGRIFFVYILQMKIFLSLFNDQSSKIFLLILEVQIMINFRNS